jgi:(4S)-4-hydroxy-5-phosphonooxypentane-2,3-dione isomerase
MLKSISIAAATLALCVVGAMMLPIPGQQVAAQSAGLFVNAVDLDIVPAEREKFLAAITENGMASVKEPGCRRFDILNLGSDPNHFFLYEIYDNEAALKAHRETPHFKKYAATTANMVAKREARPMSVIASNAK